MIVLDTSVLVDFLRGVENPTSAALAGLAEQEATLAIPVVCCQELLQGARDEAEWQTLYDYLSTQELLAASDPLTSHVAAARIYYDCRRQGLTLRGSVDCFVAQLALENDATLLHNDEDFARISRVRPLKLWDAVRP